MKKTPRIKEKTNRQGLMTENGVNYLTLA